MSSPEQEAVPPGVVGTPQGNVPYVNISSQDYARLVFSAPYYLPVAIAEIIQPSVTEAVQAILPSLVPPYVQDAANNAVAALAVPIGGGAMTGPLMLSPTMPTAPSMAASMAYVQSQVATVVPEVPPVPANQAWARETGQWIPLAGGGTVTNIATGAGLTGGPITATGTISMANMAANSLKGNNTGAVAAPTDIPAGTVLTMIGAAPLASPVFTGSPSLPTGTAAITQPGGTANTTVATTAFVASTLGIYAPLASPAFTGTPSLPTGTVGVTQGPGTANNTLATTSFVSTALTPYALTSQLANYLPLSGGLLSGGLASGPAATTVPGVGSLTLNANTAASPTGVPASNLLVVGSNAAGPVVRLAAFGTAGPFYFGQAARGTATAPTAVQSGDALLTVGAQGYGATGYGVHPASMILMATENWSDTAQGTQVVFQTAPAGGLTDVNSLILNGNTATFSGVAYFSGSTTLGIGLFAGNPTLNLASNQFVATTASGGIQITNGLTGAAGYISLNAGSNSYVSFGGAGGIPGANNLLNWGIPTDAWFQVASYNFPNPSDPRGKEDMQPAPSGALDIVGRVPVQAFRYVTDATRKLHHGFDATHMQEHLPHSVMEGDDDDKTLAINMPDLIACLWQAVQELNTKVEGRA